MPATRAAPAIVWRRIDSDLGFRGVAEHDVDRHLAPIDAHVSRGARFDEALLRVGIDDARQRQL